MVHTDIKPENIVFATRDFEETGETVRSSFKHTYRARPGQKYRQQLNPSIRLIDFGSTVCGVPAGPGRMDRLVQTQHYRAPEVIIGKNVFHHCLFQN